MNSSLQQFQRTVGRALTGLAVLHVPILGVIAWLLGRDPWSYMAAAALLAAIPIYFYWAGHRMMHVAFALAIALVGQTSLLVLAFQDHPWQVEMHFYYFAVLAMLSGFCGWRALLFAAVLIALHHLTLNEFLPSAVYPGEADLVRVAVHAIVVVVETAMLIFIGHTIRGAFAQAEAARGEAERAANELQRLDAAREQELSKTVSRADRLGELLEGFKQEMAGSIEILHQAAAGLQAHAASLGDASTHAAKQAANAAASSTHTASQVNLAADTGQQLAQTIGEVGSSAANSSRLAAAAVAEAKATNDTINEMAAVAGEIGNVTELITAIAAMALGVGDLGQRSAAFIDRAKWFAVDNERGKEVVVALGRESWTLEETAENGHSFTDVVSRAAAEAATLRLSVRLPVGDPRSFTGEVQFVPPTGVSVISDIDDTIKISNVLDKRELIANTLLRPYQAVAGMPERYAELGRRGCFFHYVSASPWQLWPSLEPFMAEHYPKGTIWLRHFRLKDSSFRDFLLKSSKDFKRTAIRTIFDRYPGHRFVLVGDSGENDPEIFGEMFSDRVERILVRRVPGSDLSDRRLRGAFQRVPDRVWELIE